MTENTHETMHRNHRDWLSDGALWRDEINLWLGESEYALANLMRLEGALRRLVQSIRAHQDGVNQHLVKVSVHERSLGEFEETGEGDSLGLLTLAKAHKLEDADHALRSEAHERIKKEYLAVMAQWNMLLRELSPDQGYVCQT
jgi:hypothetical protein